MRLTSLRWLVVLLSIGIPMAMLAGCGDGRPARAPISGQVLIDGKPLTYGTVCIVPKDARMASGEIGPDGRFTMRCFDENDGAVLGTHPIKIDACKLIDSSTRKWFAPKKYNDTKTSGKTVTVDTKNEPLIIELTWDGGKPFTEKFVNGKWQ